MPRSLTAKEILGIRRKTITLEGEWGRCIGTMDRSGVVFFWGNSGNGKSAAVISLCKELTRFGKVLFITLEEGFSLSPEHSEEVRYVFLREQVSGVGVRHSG